MMHAALHQRTYTLTKFTTVQTLWVKLPLDGQGLILSQLMDLMDFMATGTHMDEVVSRSCCNMYSRQDQISQNIEQLGKGSLK